MLYTEHFFKLPMKLYDGFKMKKAMKAEEENLQYMDNQDEVDWVEGILEVRLEEIIGYHTYFSRGRNVDEVKKEGFDCTLVETDTIGQVICLWPLKTFKQNLNKFAEEYKIKILEEIKKSAKQETEGDTLGNSAII